MSFALCLYAQKALQIASSVHEQLQKNHKSLLRVHEKIEVITTHVKIQKKFPHQYYCANCIPYQVRVLNKPFEARRLGRMTVKKDKESKGIPFAKQTIPESRFFPSFIYGSELIETFLHMYEKDLKPYDYE